jgi:hypothetical protein
LDGHTPLHNPARGAKFLVFGVIVGMIALLRQYGETTNYTRRLAD